MGCMHAMHAQTDAERAPSLISHATHDANEDCSQTSAAHTRSDCACARVVLAALPDAVEADRSGSRSERVKQATEREETAWQEESSRSKVGERRGERRTQVEAGTRLETRILNGIRLRLPPFKSIQTTDVMHTLMQRRRNGQPVLPLLPVPFTEKGSEDARAKRWRGTCLFSGHAII